jgi:MraZ protein
VDTHGVPCYPTLSRHSTALLRRRLTPQSSGWGGLACALRGCLVDRFLSSFTHRFDAKGRISIPASFRQVLAKDGFAGVYAYPSLDAPALDCGGNALIAEIDSLLQTMPPYSQSRDAFATALLGMSEVLRLDAEGRVFFEERLKTAMGLGSEAVFVGQGHKFQIWEPTRFQVHLEQARERVRRLRAERDAQAPPGAPG